MPYDAAAVRARFPALASGVAHFDGPGGSQTPAAVLNLMWLQVVAEAVRDPRTCPAGIRRCTQALACTLSP